MRTDDFFISLNAKISKLRHTGDSANLVCTDFTGSLHSRANRLSFALWTPRYNAHKGANYKAKMSTFGWLAEQTPAITDNIEHLDCSKIYFFSVFIILVLFLVRYSLFLLHINLNSFFSTIPWRPTIHPVTIFCANFVFSQSKYKDVICIIDV